MDCLLSVHDERLLQVLSKLGTELWQGVVGSYQARHATGLQAAAAKLLTLLTDMDQLLSTHRCPLAMRVSGWKLRTFLDLSCLDTCEPWSLR